MKHRQSPGRSGSRQPQRSGRGQRDAGLMRIFGVHAAIAALANPRRTIRAIHATPNAAARIAVDLPPGKREIRQVTPKDLDRMLGESTVHQGILVEADPLPALALADLPEARLLLFLDQITDPHNVGAILRSSAAFDVDGLVMTAHHSPPLDGALAKAASGGLEHVPILLVPNLARALTEAGELGFMRYGLDSGADAALDETPPAERIALVLGAEDRGLRRLTREHCDAICALKTVGAVASLNVSNAAAIALYLTSQTIKAAREAKLPGR
jgi:23S rRNA (guanosine2251-2'-O)-methyltransferase